MQELRFGWRGGVEAAGAALEHLWFIAGVEPCGLSTVSAAVKSGVRLPVAAIFVSDALGGVTFDPRCLSLQEQDPVVVLSIVCDDMSAVERVSCVRSVVRLQPQSLRLFAVSVSAPDTCAASCQEQIVEAVKSVGGIQVPPHHRVLTIEGQVDAIPAPPSRPLRVLLPPSEDSPSVAALSGMNPLDQARHLALPLAKARLVRNLPPAVPSPPAAPAGCVNRLLLRLFVPAVHCKSCTAKIGKGLTRSGFVHKEGFVCDVEDREVLVLLPPDAGADQVAGVRSTVLDILRAASLPAEPRRVSATRAVFSVTGMTCKSCEARLRKMLRPRRVQVEWEQGLLVAVFPGAGPVDEACLEVLRIVNKTEKFSAAEQRREVIEEEAPDVVCVPVLTADEDTSAAMAAPKPDEDAAAPSSSSAAALDAAPEQSAGTAAWLDTNLLVKDMTCASCAARIEDHMGEHPLVSRCVVNFSTCTAKVRHSAELGTAAVAAEITSLGYRASPMTGGGAGRSEDFRKSLTREDDIADSWEAAKKSLALALPLIVIFLILARNSAFREKVLHFRIVNGVTIAPVIQLLMSTPVVFRYGQPFFTRACAALSHRTFTMDVLVALGVASAFAASALTLVMAFCDTSDKPDHRDYHFHTAAMLIAFMLLGKYLEAKAKSSTAKALLGLLDLQPSSATRIAADGSLEEVDIDTVTAGDRLRVVTGSKIPVDGVVDTGAVCVDESMLTGESVPVSKHKGEKVAGGTLCVDGAATVTATHDASESTPAQIFNLVNNAQMSKAPVQKYADKASAVFVPCVVCFAAFVFVLWLVLGAAEAYPEHWRYVSGKDAGVFVFAAKFLITTLVIACPCAMGLATPTAVMVGTGVGAQHGVFIKGGEALEAASGASCVLFDKTGTLTMGKLEIKEEVSLPHPRLTAERVLVLTAAAEAMSQHPIAKSITARGQAVSGSKPLPDARSTTTTAGRGVSVVVEGATVIVGAPRWVMGQVGCSEASAAATTCDRLVSRGLTVVLAAIDGVPAVCFGLSDTVKPEACAVVSHLRSQLSCEVFMVTGDAVGAARCVADQCGIPATHIFAGVLPGDKAGIVQQLQRLDTSRTPPAASPLQSGMYSPVYTSSDRLPSSGKINVPYARMTGGSSPSPRRASPEVGDAEEGFELSSLRSPVAASSEQLLRDAAARCVVFIGDGINDAPALAAADVGVALGAGTSIAIDAADAVLARNDLRDVATFLDLSRATMRRIRMNFLWAVGYNVIALPVAAGALLPLMGTQMPPVVGGMAMIASSLCVLLSSLALKRYTPPNVRPQSLRV